MKVRDIVEGRITGVITIYNESGSVDVSLVACHREKIGKYMDCEVVDVNYNRSNVYIEIDENETVNRYKLHHSALTRGYVSKKEVNGIFERYEGKFGKGYTLKKV